MLYFLELKLGLPNSSFAINEFVPLDIVDNIVKKFNIKKEQLLKENQLKEQAQNYFKQKTLVFLSTEEPPCKKTWYKKKLKDINFLTQYTKEQDGKLKFYYKIRKNHKFSEQDIMKLTVLVTYSLIVSNMMKHNILYLHGVLTKHGDVFFGPSYCGKTTLAHRLLFKNRYNQAVVSDGMVVNFDKQINFYPIPEIWLYGKITVFDKFFVQNKGYKKRNLYYLLKGEKEEVKKMNKEKWIQNFKKCNRTIFNIPLAYDRGTSYLKQKEKWIDCGQGMRQKIQKRYQELVNKFLQNNKEYLAFSANSIDYDEKVKNIQDEV